MASGGFSKVCDTADAFVGLDIKADCQQFATVLLRILKLKKTSII